MISCSQLVHGQKYPEYRLEVHLVARWQPANVNKLCHSTPVLFVRLCEWRMHKLVKGLLDESIILWRHSDYKTLCFPARLFNSVSTLTQQGSRGLESITLSDCLKFEICNLTATDGGISTRLTIGVPPRRVLTRLCGGRSPCIRLGAFKVLYTWLSWLYIGPTVDGWGSGCLRPSLNTDWQPVGGPEYLPVSPRRTWGVQVHCILYHHLYCVTTLWTLVLDLFGFWLVNNSCLNHVSEKNVGLVRGHESQYPTQWLFNS